MFQRRSAVLCIIAFVALASVLASSVAQEKKGPNIQESPKGVKESATTKAIADMELASRLIQHGRKNKHAESLLVAAQILHKTPSEALTVGHTTDKGSDKAPPAQKTDNSPSALVAEAKKMSSSLHVAGLAMATQKLIDETTRGAKGGPKVDAFTIKPGETINWNPITFIGGQKAVVHVDNGVYGAMVLEVRDDLGNLIARDNVPGSYFRVEWVPLFTGPFRIRLTNLDSVLFNCGMATN